MLVIKQFQGEDLEIILDKDHPVPSEIKLFKALAPANCRYLCRLKRYDADEKFLESHREFLHYEPHGDLAKLLYRYRRYRQSKRDPTLESFQLNQSAGSSFSSPLFGISSISSQKHSWFSKGAP